MSTELVHLGYGHYLSADEIVVIAVPKSAPLKRSVLGARAQGVIIDLTNGRKTKSVIFTRSGYVVLSALEPITINGRLANSV